MRYLLADNTIFFFVVVVVVVVVVAVVVVGSIKTNTAICFISSLAYV